MTKLGYPMNPIKRGAFHTALMMLLCLGSVATCGAQESYLSQAPRRQLHGIALPKAHVEIAPTVSGWLTKVLVTEGQAVKEGQAIAVIDDRVARAAAERARIDAASTARIRQTKIILKQTEALYQRVQSAYAENASSRIELINTQYEVERARAEHDAETERKQQSHQQWKLALAELERHIIRAPFDGQIIQIHARKGESLGMQDKVVTVAALDQLEVELFLPVEMFGQLDAQNTYQIQAAAPVNRIITARLVSAAPMIDPATSTFRCVFSIDNADGSLPAGFAAILNVTPNDPAIDGIAQQ